MLKLLVWVVLAVVALLALCSLGRRPSSARKRRSSNQSLPRRPFGHFDNRSEV